MSERTTKRAARTATWIASILSCVTVASAQSAAYEPAYSTLGATEANPALGPWTLQVAGGAYQLGAFSYTVTHEGNGCPRGTVENDVATSSERGRRYLLDFSFERHELSSGVGGAEEQTSSCRITIKVKGLPGTQFALHSAIFRGQAVLDEGTRAVVFSSHESQGLGPPRAQSKSMLGPHDDLWELYEPFSDKRWSDCGADHTVILETSLKLYNPEKKSKGRLSFEISEIGLDAKEPVEVEMGARACT